MKKWGLFLVVLGCMGIHDCNPGVERDSWNYTIGYEEYMEGRAAEIHPSGIIGVSSDAALQPQMDVFSVQGGHHICSSIAEEHPLLYAIPPQNAMVVFNDEFLVLTHSYAVGGKLHASVFAFDLLCRLQRIIPLGEEGEDEYLPDGIAMLNYSEFAVWGTTREGGYIPKEAFLMRVDNVSGSVIQTVYSSFEGFANLFVLESGWTYMISTRGEIRELDPFWTQDNNWPRQYDSPCMFVRNATYSSQGTFLLAGYRYDGAPSLSCFTEIDIHGNVLENRELPNQDDQIRIPKKFFRRLNGKVVEVGQGYVTYGDQISQLHGYMKEWSPDFDLLADHRYYSSGEAVLYDATVDTDGRFYLTGEARANDHNPDTFFLKLAPDYSVPEVPTQIN